ncbi:hypothetical protein ACFQPB_07960 [Hydrogenophaga atypica]|uniref:Transmembrane protein n=2 Tax=Hydrogenophaga atypica TaxID=249409 RepID=A0ABW2QIH0_9BURK
MSSRPPEILDALPAGLPCEAATLDTEDAAGAADSLWGHARAVGVVVLAVVWAVASHYASTHPGSSGWGAVLALVPITSALAVGLSRLPHRWLGALLGMGVIGLLVGFWPHLKGQVALLYYLEHLGVYLLMAHVFGRSLRGPGESLVTRMARSVHGGVLSPAQLVYTRRVTGAWCVFFVGMAVMSTLLFVLAPVVVWSTFANLLGGPLIVLMFVGEYFWRRHALPDDKPSTMADAVRAWKAQRANSVK